MTHDDERDARLTRLLQSAGPDSLPRLEPDPGLAARIRALSRETLQETTARRRPRRWIPVSLAAAAVAVALVVGGWVGYTAGANFARARSSATAATTTAASGQTETLATLYNAWSQSGFAEDLQSWDTSTAEVQQ